MRNWRFWIVAAVVIIGLGAAVPIIAQSADTEFIDLMDEAIALYFEGDYAGAIEIINDAVEIAPNDSSAGFAYDWRGWIRYMQGDFAKALADLNRAVESDSSDAIFFIDRAMMNVMVGDHDAAIEDYERAIDMNTDYHFYADLEAFDLSSAEFLIRNYTVAIETNPTDYAAITFRGSQYANIGMWDEAIADYERALELQPGFTPAIQALTDVREVRENPGDRIVYCPIAELESIVPSLEIDSTLEGTIDSFNFFALYCLNIEDGTTLTITMEATSGDLEPAFSLYDEETDLIADTEADRLTGDTITITWTFEQGGYYLILPTRINGENGSSEGDFILTVSSGAGVSVDCSDPNADESKCGGGK